jgi:hypothetical protein
MVSPENQKAEHTRRRLKIHGKKQQDAFSNLWKKLRLRSSDLGKSAK